MKSKTSATQEFAAKQSVRRTAEQSAVHDVYRSTTPPEEITVTSYINPVRNFYQENDFQISQRDEIQETYDQLYELSGLHIATGSATRLVQNQYILLGGTSLVHTKLITR